jgi:hypothetical protein
MPSRGIDFGVAFGVPLGCVGASVLINIVLAKLGILEPASLQGTPPPILDVSLQLVFTTVGAAVTIASAKDSALSAKVVWPLIGCVAGLCLVLGLLAISEVPWSWVASCHGWLRVYLPDFVGAGTVGICIWSLRSA